MAEILNREGLKYTGKVQPQLGEVDENGQIIYPYLPDEDLIEAVNLAIQLERPLLIKGEPGCGKTKLARAVAYELGLPYETWNIKSTSRAKDGLYTYDAVGRLRDAQLAAAGRLSEDKIKEIDKSETYIKWGPLGRAFLKEQTTVVLIDEIDKADIDFPNDLLLELDEKRFVIEEINQTIPKENEKVAEPIIIITSNSERDLPEAFLRRCFFHYIEPLTKEELIKIIKAHFGDLPELVTKEVKKQEIEKLITELVDRFAKLREAIDRGSGKKVSTSELLDWIRALLLSPEDIERQLEKGIPFLGTLLKTPDELIRYRQTKNRQSQSDSAND